MAGADLDLSAYGRFVGALTKPLTRSPRTPLPLRCQDSDLDHRNQNHTRRICSSLAQPPTCPDAGRLVGARSWVPIGVAVSVRCQRTCKIIQARSSLRPGRLFVALGDVNPDPSIRFGTSPHVQRRQVASFVRLLALADLHRFVERLHQGSLSGIDSEACGPVGRLTRSLALAGDEGLCPSRVDRCCNLVLTVAAVVVEQ